MTHELSLCATTGRAPPLPLVACHRRCGSCSSLSTSPLLPLPSWIVVVAVIASSSSFATNVFELKKKKTKSLGMVIAVTVDDSPSKAKINGIILAKTKPSYALRRGIGSLRSDYGSLRWEHRRRLQMLLRELVRRHNWDEASGVLSVLLKGTCKESSISRNRFKYVSAMEVLKHIKGGCINSRKIQNIYELWMKKIGVVKGRPMSDRFAVQLEFILFCLSQGDTEDAHQAVMCIMQERGSDSDPISNLVVGLSFYQLWYSNLPEEYQLKDANGSNAVPMQSETLETRLDMSIDSSEERDAAVGQEASSPFSCNSNSSIRIDKDIGLGIDAGQHQEVSKVVLCPVKKEVPDEIYHPQFYMNPNERSDEEQSISGDGGDIPNASIFYGHGMESWLLPLRLPDSNEKLEDAIDLHRTLRNDHYHNAVKYLRLALYSTPPVSEALLPLIQMLIMGDQVREALDELEKFNDHSDTTLSLRLKVGILEHFKSSNYLELSTCFEEILKRDPTCSRSLARLISIHQHGFYAFEKLVETIALHLDSTYAKGYTWKEFASCFLKLSHCEEDRISVCFNGGGEDGEEERCCVNLNATPTMFTNAASEKNWRFRCRWWLTRHFSQNILASEIAAGELELITYKAASAAHLYGAEFKYVVNAFACLQEDDGNKDMLSFLQMHMQNSIGFCLNFTPNINGK